MIKPTFEEFRELAKQGNVIPIYREILADTETPVSAYLKIMREDDFSFLLESVEGGENIARYSFLGVEPFLIFRSKGDQITIEDRTTGRVEQITGNPIAELRRLNQRFKAVHPKELPRFAGGAVGYVAYDAIRLVEHLPDNTTDDLGLEEIFFCFFDTILVFDRLRHRMILISNLHLDSDTSISKEKYQEAVGRIEAMERLLLRPIDPRLSRGRGKLDLASNFQRERFERSVEKCKEYISAGDIFQVVLSQRFETKVSVDSLDIYRMLRIVNPSPYMFHIRLGDSSIVGASPEMLVKVEDGIVETRPIAGTRPRGATEEEDVALERELLSDEKERAEHVMLLDLGRNDIGRVSEYGTVHVAEQMTIEKYSHVMHIVSSVQGKLRKGGDQFDALMACFPAGTVSGAPKIRAMEIIDELEPTKRLIYAGAVGYLDFSGNLDTCIAIRTVLVSRDKAYIQVGAGIVADSDPAREFEETVNKAKALFRAIEMAEDGSFIV